MPETTLSEHTQATARPWSADEPRTYAGVKWDCIIRDANGQPICSVYVAGWSKKEAANHAALIVKAVNNFDALVRALEQAQSALTLFRSLVNEGGVPRYGVTPGAALNSVIEEDVDPAIRHIAAALAGAK